VIGLGVAMAVSFLFTWNIVEVLKRPAGDAHFVFTEPTEAISTFMQVGFFSGVVLSTPVWLYQLVMFIAPGLTRKERRYVFSALPAVLACFAIGVAFAYFVLAPPMMNFLFHFGEQAAEQYVRLGRYISLIANVFFAAGLTFEMPLIMFVLARLGVVTPRLLSGFRRYAIVLAFVIGALITPTPDPFNQSLVALPMIVLYELGIVLSRLAVRQRERAAV
jgi:sec-independent protein translocase protein TatC